MKKQLFTMLVTIGFVAAIKPAFADDNSDMQKVMAQTTALEAQVNTLNKEITQLKAEQKAVKKTQKVQAAKIANATKPTKLLTEQSYPSVSTSSMGKVTSAAPMSRISGTPIIIAPYVGEHTAFDASDLIINYSNYNEDLRFLQLRQHVYNQLAQEQADPQVGLLMLSGKVEAQGVYAKPYHDDSTSNINLYDAELDIVPVINNWVNGFISFRYLQGVEPNTPPVVVNTTGVHVGKAFMTFGNLNCFPMYATLGQTTVPFGAYSSSMIAIPLTSAIFETKEQTAILGYQGASGQGPYGQIYAFNGDTNTNRNNNINNLGANLGFNLNNDKWNMDTSVGAIANIADSLGMQQTGVNEGAGFQGFSVDTMQNPEAETIHRQVPGLAAHFNVGVGQFSVVSEYIKATSAFDSRDMTFNGRAARPQAVNVEGNYSFQGLSRPLALSAGYGRSWDALALSVPEKRYIAALTTSIWKSTIQELEFRHDINYGTSDSATAAGVSMPANVKGGSSNTVTAQFGIYF